MKDEPAWRPTKFVPYAGGWRGSRDRREVNPGSRVTTDLQATAYAAALARFARRDLLDLGCGSVPLYGMYRPHTSTVTCVDWAKTPHPSPHVDLLADLNQPLPLDSGSFDTVVLTDVLEHMPYPDQLFVEIARLLRPHGRLIVGVPFLYGLHEEPYDYHRYTEHKLRLLADDHGMDVLDLRPYGGPSAVVLDMAAKALSLARPLRAAAGLPALVAHRLRPPTGHTPLPLGYVLVAERRAEAAAD